MNAARITVTGQSVNFGNGPGLQIPCTILFKREEIYIEVSKKKTVELEPFINLKYCQQSMKNISIIIEIYVYVRFSRGSVLRKHRVIPNVMVLYVFSFFLSQVIED